MAPKALILGISGQDGAYLARFLLKKGYTVYGTSRDAQTNGFHNLHQLGIAGEIHYESVAPNDFHSVLRVLANVQPDEVYNLAGQSSVGLSFMQPKETLESISMGALHLLEAIRFVGTHIKLYNAGSSECFGEIGDNPTDEQAPFRPRSPYAVAKATAHWEVANYREAYSLFACTGILFNHESPLRPERFVTQKIIAGACRIAAGLQATLHLGDLSIQRDWGWAPEYVEAMWQILQQPKPEDYIIATGRTYSLEEFVAYTFSALNLDWRSHVIQDTTLFRPTDIQVGRANPAKAKRQLGWQAKSFMPDVIDQMIEAFQQSLLKPSKP